MFRPISAYPSIEFRNKVVQIIESLSDDTTTTAAASEETAASGGSLPSGGEPGDILQIDDYSNPSWLRKLTVSDAPPSDSVGEDGDIRIET